ncbi:MAG TPA: hypothetical protein PLY93_13535, partial [Turneriella sp.]|nr:hypothetical protein [Turneriella sp.]
MPEKQKNLLDETVKQATQWGLRTLGAFAGSEFAQRTGLQAVARDALYGVTRTVVRAGTSILAAAKSATNLVGYPRLEKPKSSSDLFDLNFSEEQNMIAEAMGEFAEGVL